MVLQISKTHSSPHRNNMLLKDGTTSKNMLPRGLTSLLDSSKNKASSAAGPAGPAGPAAAAAPAAAPAACCGWYCWRWCCKPPKRTLCHTETPCYWRTERPPKTCCPGAWRPFWILVHAAGGTAGGGAASLQNAPFATPKHHATEGRNDLQKHAAPGLDVPSGFWKKKEIAAAGPAAAAAGAGDCSC